jgi:glycosyltransferase involved in cell wall biosynthesis
LNWHQGLDIAIQAFSAIKDEVPQAEFHIYGRGSEMNRLEEMVVSLDLTDRILLKPLLPISKIADVMANADIGIIPKRNDPFGGEAFSTKILEFMSLGIPVIVAKTKIDKYYFNDAVVKFFGPDNPNDLAKSMLELVRNKHLRETLSQNAMKFVEDFSWEKRKWEYLDLVDRLTNKK